MKIWGYPHELEYRFESAKGFREHLYTERVDDMGFCLEHRDELREDWLVRYATACAEDYLGRQRAPCGMWVVSVYRETADGRDHLVTIRTRWTAAQKNSSSRR
ncbi:hypothetical protein [Amycolatopsis minnesotensis]|uniref:Uncharacterized protein n=1 Tax=Amycolatopsis minnesotensis TaxID=337894 RepID=A0ABN2RD88_9PSEU